MLDLSFDLIAACLWLMAGVVVLGLVLWLMYVLLVGVCLILAGILRWRPSPEYTSFWRETVWHDMILHRRGRLFL